MRKDIGRILTRPAFAILLIGSLPIVSGGCGKRTDTASADRMGTRSGEGTTAVEARRLPPPGTKAPSGIVIEWDDGARLTESEAIKRFGRFERNVLWDKMERLARKCIETPSAELQKYGYWYLSRVFGRRIELGEYATPEEAEALKRQALDYLKKAIELGFTNPYEIRDAPELLPLRSDPEFVRIVEDLTEKSRQEIRANYHERVLAEVEAALRAELPALPLEGARSLDGPAAILEGTPVVLILSRIHHDGFDKLARRLDQLEEALGGPRVVFLFHQLTLDDTERIEQTRAYLEKLGLTDFPALVIDRPAYVRLREALSARFDNIKPLLPEKQRNRDFDFFEPVTVVLDRTGRPLLHANGVFEAWQIEELGNVLRPFLAKAPAEAPEGERKEATPGEAASPPPREEKPAEEKAEKKAATPPAREPEDAPKGSGEAERSETTPPEKPQGEAEPAGEKSAGEKPSSTETPPPGTPKTEPGGGSPPPADTPEGKPDGESGPDADRPGADSKASQGQDPDTETP